ncbi:carbohydrate-binding module family 18 protein [Podospora didyma]|uniref:Carbohydrate-binding module family 18 protein n=1 Tax=Podospora didyma TaxID=330526 RepID=A0AAE0U3X4_9PEZI|nr:carbohydrate-binding module family 18 protein [Podospora didyma]
MQRLLRLPRVLLIVSIFAASHASAADTCSAIVTARDGDTCASIASAAGITVTQFIRSNPGVTCSSLTTGSKYCIDPTFAASTTGKTVASPTSGTGAAPTSTLQISKDGQCGGGLTCAGSSYGNCCSPHGWCGKTTDHCGTGCQADFGLCGDAGLGSSSVVGTPSPVVTQTAVVERTSTRTVVLTSTAAVVTTQTQVVRTTATETMLTTLPVATSFVLRTTVVTQNSIVFISSTVTTIRTITITDAGKCATLGRTLNVPRATAAAVAGGILLGQPSPIQLGVSPDCQTFYQARDDDSCESIVEKHKRALNLEDFYSWNSQITADYPKGEYYLSCPEEVYTHVK